VSTLHPHISLKESTPEVYRIICSRIADLVRRSKLKEAANLLWEIAVLWDSETAKEAAVIQCRLTHVQADFAAGQLDQDYYYRAHNKIANDILELLEKI
jgi:hypothetical protein